MNEPDSVPGFTPPEITPLAKRLAEDSGVVWRILSGAEGGPITEDDVLNHLTGTLKDPPTGEAVGIDFGSLAASLSEVLGELLAEADRVSEPPVLENPLPENPQLENPVLEGPVLEGPVSEGAVPAGSVPEDWAAEAIANLLVPTPPETPEDDLGSGAGADALGRVQARLEAERRAHTQTQKQLGELKASAVRQKTLAAQLRPLAAEIRRLGSALGVANAEMERLRSLEGLVASLQEQLEQARVDEARVRLLCRDLQAQRDLLEDERRQRPRWQFWRRST